MAADPVGRTDRLGADRARAGGSCLAVTMLVFSAFPIANLVLGFSTKDYGLWYQVGLAVRHGLDVYPRPESQSSFSLHVSRRPRRRCLRGSACSAGLARCWRL